MAVVAPTEVTIKAIVTVQTTIGGMFAHIGLNRGLDDITDMLGKSLLLELVSSELDPSMRHASYKSIINIYAWKIKFFFYVPNNTLQLKLTLTEIINYSKTQRSSKLIVLYHIIKLACS